MPSEMVDRLADVLERHFEDHQNEWPVAERPGFDCRALARLVIAAMREPTESMVHACEPDEDAGPIWRDMIDAALDEKAKP